MTISFTCPSCGAPLNAPDEYAGGKARCKACMTPVGIPKPGVSAHTAAVIPETAHAGSAESVPAVAPTPGTEASDGAVERAGTGSRPKLERMVLGLPLSGAIIIGGLVLVAGGLIVGIIHRHSNQAAQPQKVAVAPEQAALASVDQATSEPHASDQTRLSSDHQSTAASSDTALLVYDPVRHDLVLYRDEFLATFAPLAREFHSFGDQLDKLDDDGLSRFMISKFVPQVQRMHDAIVSHLPFTEPVRTMHHSLILYAKALVTETEAMVAGRVREANSDLHMRSHQEQLARLAAEYDVRISDVAYGTDTDLHREDIDAITALSSSAKVAIPPKLVWAFDFSDGLAVVEFGMRDESGERRYGYIDADCNISIPKAFAIASRFKHGMASVRPTRNGPWGFIDKSGEYVIKPQYCAPPVLNSNGIIKVGVNCTAARPFGTPALVDQKGRVVTLDGFDYMGVGQFCEGLAVACRDMDADDQACGYIDRTGKIQIPMQFEDADGFSGGLAAVQINGRWGYIDQDGNVAIQPQFGEAYPFSEGLAVVTANDVVGPFGFIDRAGKVVIQPTFPRAGSFAEGRALVAVDTGDPAGYLYGFIDSAGGIAIEPRYNSAMDFNEGYAAVMQNHRWGFINKSGDIVVLPQFKAVGDCCEGMAWFATDDGYGYIRFEQAVVQGDAHRPSPTHQAEIPHGQNDGLANERGQTDDRLPPASEVDPTKANDDANSESGSKQESGFARAVRTLFEADKAIENLPQQRRFEIVAKLDEGLYEAVFRERKAEHFILSTVHTDFSSKGNATLFIAFNRTVELKDDSGFARSWRVFQEASNPDGSPATPEEILDMYMSTWEIYTAAGSDVSAALARHEYSANDLPLMLELIVSRNAVDSLAANHLYGSISRGPYQRHVDHGEDRKSALAELRQRLALALESLKPDSSSIILEQLEAYDGERMPSGLRQLSAFLSEFPDLVRNELSRLQDLRRKAERMPGNYNQRFLDQIISAITGERP